MPPEGNDRGYSVYSLTEKTKKATNAFGAETGKYLALCGKNRKKPQNPRGKRQKFGSFFGDYAEAFGAERGEDQGPIPNFLRILHKKTPDRMGKVSGLYRILQCCRDN